MNRRANKQCLATHRALLEENASFGAPGDASLCESASETTEPVMRIRKVGNAFLLRSRDFLFLFQRVRCSCRNNALSLFLTTHSPS